MKVNQELYYCSQCKKICSSLDDLFFVEEGSTRGFCSEGCIEDFYAPLVKHFENLENSLRTEVNLVEKDLEDLIGNASVMEKVIRRPDEIWVLRNEMMEEVYSFITKVEGDEDQTESYYLIALCLVFDKQPSFIFLATATRSFDFLNEFKIGEKVDDVSDFHVIVEKNKAGWQNLNIDQEVLTLLDNKKSSYLATLLEQRSPADIPFEKFDLYQDYLESTVEEPDELYSQVDEEGDKIFTYIKAYEREGVSFFYFVLCFIPPDNSGESKEKTLFPILAFPSLDGDLCHHYKKGEQLSGSLKN